MFFPPLTMPPSRTSTGGGEGVERELSSGDDAVMSASTCNGPDSCSFLFAVGSARFGKLENTFGIGGLRGSLKFARVMLMAARMLPDGLESGDMTLDGGA